MGLEVGCCDVHFIRGGVGEYVFDKGNLNCSIRHVTLLKILKKIAFIFTLISIRNLPYQFLLVLLSKLMFLLPILVSTSNLRVIDMILK